jgi:hypothetical protein
MVGFSTRALIQILSLVLALPLLGSCIVSRHPAGIASSTSPIPTTYTVLGSAQDSSCQYWVLLLPIVGKDSTDEMIARLVKEQGGDSLIGVTVEYRSSVFALPLFGSNCTLITGQVVRSAQ